MSDPLEGMTAADFHDGSDVLALRDLLQEIESQPNDLTLDEFKKFEPLYQAPNAVDKRGKAVVDTVVFKELSNEFMRRVDPYKPTRIYDRPKAADGSDNGREMIVELPPIMLGIHALPVDIEHATIASINQRAATMPGYPPHLAEEATARLGQKLVTEQLNPGRKEEIWKTAAETKAIVERLQALYGKPQVPGEAEAPATTTSASSVIGADEWGDN